MSDSNRSIIRETVSLLVKEVGFTHIDDDSLETLVEMLTALIREISHQTKRFSEHAGRSEPVDKDLQMALVNLGVKFNGLQKYAFRENRPIARNMESNQPQKMPQILHVGTKTSRPVHIPSYLPPLPDSHAYIRTATYSQPDTEYEIIRKKSSSQKRDMENALTKFLVRTSDETHNLFGDDDDQTYQLIASNPSMPSYMAALNPSDQIFDFDELEYYYQIANRVYEEAESEDDGSSLISEKSSVKQIQEEKNEKIINNPFLKLERRSF